MEQSGCTGFKGKPLPRRREAARREIRLDLSRKVYTTGNHLFFSGDLLTMKDREKHHKKVSGAKWTVTITFVSFALTIIFSLLSELVTDSASLVLSVLIVLLLIAVSILADLVGTAVTVCDAAPLIAMSSRKVKGAKSALRLLRNNEKVASICNDVIGDICGIVSGAATVAIVYMILTQTGGGSEGSKLLLSTLLSALVACLTIGGKAFGKNYAMKNSKQIVFGIGKMISVLHRNEK